MTNRDKMCRVFPSLNSEALVPIEAVIFIPWDAMFRPRVKGLPGNKEASRGNFQRTENLAK